METKFFGAAFLLLAWFSALRAGLAAWRWNVVRRTVRTPLGAAARGPVEVMGCIEPMELLTAPLSGRPCVFYEWAVEERRGGDEGEHGWVKLRGGRDGRPFLLADESGRAVVHAIGARCLVQPAIDESCWLLRPPSARMAALLQRSGVSPEGRFGLPRHLEVSEYILEPETSLYVIGTARPCGRGEGRFSGAQMSLDPALGVLELSDRGENRLRQLHRQEAVRFFVGALASAGLAAALLAGWLD